VVDTDEEFEQGLDGSLSIAFCSTPRFCFGCFELYLIIYFITKLKIIIYFLMIYFISK
jgi:hypothetical protein